MEALLIALRAAAEPTRLRILALAGRGAFCVSEFTEILGQSQPRLSRHLKLLCEAGLLERVREGANVWFAVPTGEAGGLTRELLTRVAEDDPTIAADRRQAARVLSERARTASESFQRKGADWDEMRAMGLPATSIEEWLLTLVPEGHGGRLLDIGTGTGRVLEILGPRVDEGLGIDASRAMLALARSRLAKAGLAHCSVRLADMYRLPLRDACFDIAVLQMVLHHADDPEGVLAEAARVLRPGGNLIVIDLADHQQSAMAEKLAHRWPGFADDLMQRWLAGTGSAADKKLSICGPAELPVRIWSATRTAAAPIERLIELAV